MSAPSHSITSSPAADRFYKGIAEGGELHREYMTYIKMTQDLIGGIQHKTDPHGNISMDGLDDVQLTIMDVATVMGVMHMIRDNNFSSHATRAQVDEAIADAPPVIENARLLFSDRFPELLNAMHAAAVEMANARTIGTTRRAN